MANKRAPYKDKLIVEKVVEFIDSLPSNVDIMDITPVNAYKMYLVYMADDDTFAETLNYSQFNKVFAIAVLMRGNI